MYLMLSNLSWRLDGETPSGFPFCLAQVIPFEEKEVLRMCTLELGIPQVQAPQCRILVRSSLSRVPEDGGHASAVARGPQYA